MTYPYSTGILSASDLNIDFGALYTAQSAQTNRLNAIESKQNATGEFVFSTPLDGAGVPIGFTANYTGGIVRLTSGTWAAIAPGSLSVPANATTFVWSAGGSIAQGAAPPVTAAPLARITSNATRITAITLAPTREERATAATLADVTNAQPQRLVTARRTTDSTNLPLDAYWSPVIWSIADDNVGNILNAAAGTITIAATIKLQLGVRLRLISADVNSSVAAKISVFIGASEQAVLQESGTTKGGLVIGGIWKPREAIAAGSVITIRPYLNDGTNVRISGSNSNELWLEKLS